MEAQANDGEDLLVTDCFAVDDKLVFLNNLGQVLTALHLEFAVRRLFSQSA